MAEWILLFIVVVLVIWFWCWFTGARNLDKLYDKAKKERLDG